MFLKRFGPPDTLDLKGRCWTVTRSYFGVTDSWGCKLNEALKFRDAVFFLTRNAQLAIN
jgi:hypothetical protein